MFPACYFASKFCEFLLLLCIALSIGGCRQGQGVITGTVVLTGAPPPEIKIRFDAVSAKLQLTNHVATRHYVVGSNGGLANVLVYVKGNFSNAAMTPRTNAASLEIHRTVYEPFVQAVQTNQPLRLRNRDPILHNVMITPPRGNTNKERSFVLRSQDATHSLSFDTATTLDSTPARTRWIDRFAIWFRLKPAPRKASSSGPFLRFKCSVHPWEFAWVAVLDHPFFAVTKGDGTFELPPLPAGTYTIEAIHLRAGTNTQRITIAGGQRKAVTIKMQVPPMAQ